MGQSYLTYLGSFTGISVCPSVSPRGHPLPSAESTAGVVVVGLMGPPVWSFASASGIEFPAPRTAE